ncbi:tetratricopeptide repeat protein [Virgibacillus byunsanensis]|uniref:Tetratricopeptide repeat protein n=1 Tax=Virgibacillus byunsanensis TaxID=570945 RepID=A0ABW3LGT0_9BACI
MEGKLKRAFAFLNKGNFKQAEILYLECLDRLEDSESKLYKQALHGLGFVKNELENFQEATEIYMKLLHMARKKGNKEEEGISYHQLGIVQRKSGNHDQALLHFADEHDIYHAHFPDFHLGLAVNLYESGMIYQVQNKLMEAAHMMEESLRHAKQTDDLVVIGSVYRGLGDIFKQSGDNDKAVSQYQNALAVFKQANDSQAVEEMDEKLRDL